MKKILCGVLIASLSMSLLSGCGKTSSSQAPENQETQVSEPETSENEKEENEKSISLLPDNHLCHRNLRPNLQLGKQHRSQHLATI